MGLQNEKVKATLDVADAKKDFEDNADRYLKRSIWLFLLAGVAILGVEVFLG